MSTKRKIGSMKKLKENEGVGSVYLETKHFSTTTTVNGPRRIFNGKGCARFFWIIVVFAVFAFLLYQIGLVFQTYFSKPTLSQISFIANDGGMDFPAVTLCNLNPVKTSYIHKLNSSGEISNEVLNYLLATKTNSIFMFNNANKERLEQAHKNALTYIQNHPEFNIIEFLNAAQFDCEELVETCYFGGKQFNCCDYMTKTVTSLGKCWELNFQNGTEEWMKKQISPRKKSGLQIVVNTRYEEQFTDFQYSSFQENGFRYFIHPSGVNPEISSEGITVSPSRIVNSAIKAVLHDLLNRANWGNCSHSLPSKYNSSVPYSSSLCQAYCIATHFDSLCGCAPFSYNIDGNMKTCLPYEEVLCMQEKMTKTDDNGTVVLDLPLCSDCHLACQKTSYTSYSSYGDGFNNSSMNWLMNLTHRSKNYISENIAVINIHFFELFYTQYTQVKNASVSKSLTDMFGLNGLWFGMSIVSFTELLWFLIKISWLMVSRRRRRQLIVKQKSEKRKEKNIEVAVKEVEESKSRMNSSANLSYLDADESPFWYRNNANFSSSSLNSVIQLADEFQEGLRFSVKEVIPEEDENQENFIDSTHF